MDRNPSPTPSSTDSPTGAPTRPDRRRRAGWRRAALAFVAATALLTAACGGSGSDSGDRGSGGTGGGSGGGGTAAADLPPCPLDALTNHTGPKIELTVWHFLSAKTKESLEGLAAKYNASQDKVEVKVESQGTNNDEVWKKYTAGISSKQLPGIAILDDTVTQQIADSGTVLPAQSCIDADRYDMSDFLPTGKAYYTLDGVLYPGSLNLSGALLYYNKNHFRKAGLDPDKTPKTLAELREYAEKIKAANIAGLGKPIILNLGAPLVEMWLTGVGQPVVNNDNGRGGGTTDAAAFDTDTTRELYTWIDQMSADGLLEVLPNTSGQINHYLGMANQTSSITIETSTAATSVEAFLGGNLDTSAVPGVDSSAVDLNALDFGAAEVPGLREPGKLSMGGGAWYMTNTGPPEVQAAAWDFIKFFNTVDSQVQWNIDGSYLPYRMSAVEDPRLKAKWTDTLSGRWLAIAYDELLNGIDPAFPGPLMGPYDQFRQSIRGSIDAMIFKDTPPDAAIRTASDETTKALGQYQEGGF